MMRIRIVFAAILVSLSWEASGQTQEPKRSGSRFEKYRKSDVAQVDDLLRQARALKTSDPASALTLVEDAIGISLSNQQPLPEARCYLVLGEINEVAGEWKLALEHYKTAHDRLKPAYGDTGEMATALQGMAHANLRLGNFAESLSLYQQARAVDNLSPDREADIRIGMSEVYYQQARYAEALRILDEISSREKRRQSPAHTTAIENQYAKIFARMNELDRARKSLESAQRNTLSHRDAVPPAQNTNTIEAKDDVAEVLHGQQRYDEEIAVRSQSIEFNLESNNLPEVSRDKVGIGKALAAKGETSAAIRELREAALIADTIGNPREQAGAFLGLAELYDKNRMPGEAIGAYRKYSEAMKEYEAMNQSRLTEKADLIQRQRDIEELSREVEIALREDAIAQAALHRQQLIIYGLIAIIILIAVSSYFIHRNARESKVANQLLALKSLRSQMNPHFIFNALNSVNQFIALNDEKAANKFLSDFSRLMRLVLENSQEDFITLDKEKEIITLYLKLEHYRFRDKFDYEIKIDDDINGETQLIPPMLVQPYIENAVWHGLRYKEDKGLLTLHLRRNANGLEVEITDNGIGRKRSAELKTTHQKKQVSTGLKNIRERLHIINRVYHTSYRVDIDDLYPEGGAGTRVVIHIPPLNGHVKHLRTT